MVPLGRQATKGCEHTANRACAPECSQDGHRDKDRNARGLEQLPAILLKAMRGRRVGVMIARGDLAVECGWERLAEV